MSRLIDITGQRYGNLVVIERDENCKGRNVYWKCRCDCGKITSVLSCNLKSGKTCSCGCGRHKKYVRYRNSYDLTSYDYGVGYTLKEEPFYFDKEDYELIKDYCWHYDKEGYVVASVTIDGKQTTIKMHRIIFNVTNSRCQVDHIYHVHHDNRKSQLRLVTNQENQYNKQISSNNTSGKTGVSWNKREQKWRAYITINDKQISLGYYNSFEQALNARVQGEKKYFGEYAYQASQL